MSKSLLIGSKEAVRTTEMILLPSNIWRLVEKTMLKYHQIVLSWSYYANILCMKILSEAQTRRQIYPFLETFDIWRK